ncbi:RNA polymerase-binding protein RbpA [Saccharopolyspora pogona]|uniref:RNA polymerase-binding protein RbpA n=1 Tax=Saccharopolyspora pogona TaxID=333966 RepID=UPI00168914CE|nr:RNA polymerase-binding protein RbpA [Saccharopolyspora pogona]
MRPSYQRPGDYEPAERLVEAYRCPRGEAFTVTYAVDSAVPETWECRQHGLYALRVDLAATVADMHARGRWSFGRAPQGQPSKTHLEHVLERRSPRELQELVDERLGELAAARDGS